MSPRPKKTRIDDSERVQYVPCTIFNKDKEAGRAGSRARQDSKVEVKGQSEVNGRQRLGS